MTADFDGVASTVAAVKLSPGGPNVIGTLRARATSRDSSRN